MKTPVHPTTKATRINQAAESLPAKMPPPMLPPRPATTVKLDYSKNRSEHPLTDRMMQDGELYFNRTCEVLKLDAADIATDIFGTGRNPLTVRVRNTWRTALALGTKYSQPEIAAITGDRSHSSVTGAMKKVASSSETSMYVLEIFRHRCPHCDVPLCGRDAEGS